MFFIVTRENHHKELPIIRDHRLLKHRAGNNRRLSLRERLGIRYFRGAKGDRKNSYNSKWFSVKPTETVGATTLRSDAGQFRRATNPFDANFVGSRSQ